MSALDEYSSDLEEMGFDDNKGEQSINRLWPESANDGGYTYAPTETGCGPLVVRRPCDMRHMPTTDFSGWNGVVTAHRSGRRLSCLRGYGVVTGNSLETTQFVTKTPEGLSMAGQGEMDGF